MRASYLLEEGQHLHIFSDFVNGGPAHLNAKPPFTTWIQALSLKIFGYNLLALRLPIVLMAVFTIFLMIWIAKKTWKEYGLGLFAGLILVSSSGFVSTHIARTGDQDAALTFYLFVSLIFFYLFLDENNSRKRNIYLAIVTTALIAAFLTKSVVAFFFLPGFLVYLIYKKSFLRIVKNRSTYFALMGFLVPVALYYGITEWNNPGYLDWFINRELLHRYSTGVDGNIHPFLFYGKHIWEGGFFPWILFIPITLVLVFNENFRKYRDLTVLLSSTSLLFFLIISISKTKYFWYTAPIYPLLSLLAGIAIFEIFRNLQTLFKNNQKLKLIFSSYLILALFFLPYKKIIDRFYLPENQSVKEQFGDFMEHLEKKQPTWKNYTIAYIGFNGHVCYYAGIFNRTKEYQIKLSNSVLGKEEGDLVLICEPRINTPLEKTYEIEVLERYQDCKMVRIQHIREKKINK